MVKKLRKDDLSTDKEKITYSLSEEFIDLLESRLKSSIILLGNNKGIDVILDVICNTVVHFCEEIGKDPKKLLAGIYKNCVIGLDIKDESNKSNNYKVEL